MNLLKAGEHSRISRLHAEIEGSLDTACAVWYTWPLASPADSSHDRWRSDTRFPQPAGVICDRE